MLRKIDTIVVHCSDSPYGSREIIDEWHRERGWSEIGYHFVIYNCYPTELSYKNGQPELSQDGWVVTARPLEKIGAHVKGLNRN